MTKKRLLYLSVGLGALVLILLLVLILRWESRAAFSFVEILVTFTIGLLGNVLAAGWFIWLFQKDDLYRMDHLMTTTDKINDTSDKIKDTTHRINDTTDRIKDTCQFLYQRGIWVANKRVQLNNSFYEQHYQSSTKVDILGIANKGFMRSFYSGYVNKDFDLDKALIQPLFVELQKTPGFLVTVLFLDPDSAYAKERNKEYGNKRTIQDLEEIRNALTKIGNAYRSESENWRLKGRIEFMMFKENPNYSLFQARSADDSEKSVMVVGLLPKNMSGDDCPSVIMHQNADHRSLFASYAHHLEELKRSSETVLSWDAHGVWFKPWDRGRSLLRQ
jgi:hypothetical protein